MNLLTVENAESLIMNMFFDPEEDMILLRSEDINLIKRLAISARIKGKTLAEPVADPRTRRNNR